MRYPCAPHAPCSKSPSHSGVYSALRIFKSFQKGLCVDRDSLVREVLSLAAPTAGGVGVEAGIVRRRRSRRKPGRCLIGGQQGLRRRGRRWHGRQQNGEQIDKADPPPKASRPPDGFEAIAHKKFGKQVDSTVTIYYNVNRKRKSIASKIQIIAGWKA